MSNEVNELPENPGVPAEESGSVPPAPSEKSSDMTTPAKEETPAVVSVVPAGKIKDGVSVGKDYPFQPQDTDIVVFPGANQETIDGPFRKIAEALTEDEWKVIARSEWPELLKFGAELFSHETASKPLDREGSVWSNQYEDSGRKIGLRRPRAAASAGNQQLTGIKAMARASAQLGIGSPVSTPLPHSGFWLTIKQPLNSDLLDLEAKLVQQKAILGRATRGRSFSTADVFIKSTVMNFILDFVVGSNWYGDYTDRESLKNVIRLPDVNLVIAAVANSLYPKGFLYTQPCLSRPGECKATYEGRIAINEMIWIDESYLTQRQSAIISRPDTPFTTELETEYREAFATKGKSSFVVKGIRFDLRVPTFAQYEAEGIAWIESIRQRCEQAFQSKLAGDEREAYIVEQGRATAMRQYSHWIERIVFLDEDGNENGYVEDREDLATQLGIYTDDEELTNTFYAKVEDFISDCTFGVVAVSNFICPACVAGGHHGQQPVIGGRFDHLIAVDPAGVFFTLTSLRLSKTRQRVDI